MERFWSKVEKSSGCWKWLGALHSGGYGLFRYLGKTVRAHRFVWEAIYGPIPPRKHVLHKCDNPDCVNPEHLFIGTAEDNAKDAVSKGRASGQKLQVSEAVKIRELYATEKYTHAELGKLFRVSRRTIGDIVNRHTFC